MFYIKLYISLLVVAMLSSQQKLDLIKEESNIRGIFFDEMRKISNKRDESLSKLNKIRTVEEYNLYKKQTTFSFGSDTKPSDKPINSPSIASEVYSKQLLDAMTPIQTNTKFGSNLLIEKNVHVSKTFYQKVNGKPSINNYISQSIMANRGLVTNTVAAIVNPGLNINTVTVNQHLKNQKQIKPQNISNVSFLNRLEQSGSGFSPNKFPSRNNNLYPSKLKNRLVDEPHGQPVQKKAKF